MTRSAEEQDLPFDDRARTGGFAFREAVEGLLRGDFSRLEPLFAGTPGMPGSTAIDAWLEQGCFDDEPAALREALTCACFLGRTELVARLLARGVDPLAGNGTGLNGLHWAANRGHLETVRLLLDHGVSMEIRNRFGGTVLDLTAWSAVHEPRPDHLAIAEALIAAGADVLAVEHPSGHVRIDELLRRHGAASPDQPSKETLS